MGVLRLNEVMAASRGAPVRLVRPAQARRTSRGMGSLGSLGRMSVAQWQGILDGLYVWVNDEKRKLDGGMSQLQAVGAKAQQQMVGAENAAATLPDGSGYELVAAIQAIGDEIRGYLDEGRGIYESSMSAIQRAVAVCPSPAGCNNIAGMQAEVEAAKSKIGTEMLAAIIRKANAAATQIPAQVARIERAKSAAAQVAQVQAQTAAQAAAAAQAERDRIQYERDQVIAVETAKSQREQAARQQELDYQRFLRESENARIEAEAQREQARQDAALQTEQRMFELKEQQILWEQARQERQEQQEAMIRNMLLQAELMQAAPQMFAQPAPQQGAFMPYGVPAGYGAQVTQQMPMWGAPQSAGPQPTWSPQTPASFNPGAEMFGLGAATAQVLNPTLQGALIEPGWKIVGPLPDGRSYRMEAPDGRKWTVPSARVSFRDPASQQVVYMPPNPGVVTVNGQVQGQPGYVQGGGGSVAEEIARAVGALAPAVTNLFQSREDAKILREQRRIAEAGAAGGGFFPAASMGASEMPTWVYGVGAGLVGLGIVAAIGKGRKSKKR